MNRSMLIAALLATLSLAACEKPTVVNVPATPVAVPGVDGRLRRYGSCPPLPGTPTYPVDKLAQSDLAHRPDPTQRQKQQRRQHPCVDRTRTC